MPEIGSLTSVPIREVWPNEAADLTPWLAENPDLLSEALEMDLELVDTEVQVGESFSADILFRSGEPNALVVVENMMGDTDHDHLGKAITYASGLAATYAVLLAEELRPEHRTALQWLNAHTTEAVGFFGVEIEAWRIGESPPAPRLSVVVRPDDWAKQVRAQTGARELTESTQRYREFWAGFLHEFHEAHRGWSRSKKPSSNHETRFPAGRTGVFYSVSRSWRDDHYRFRVALSVDIPEREEADRVYHGLVERRSEVEARFGESLTWDEAEARRARRIYAWDPSGDFRIEDRERWPEVRAWAIKRLGELRDAIQPHLDEL